MLSLVVQDVESQYNPASLIYTVIEFITLAIAVLLLCFVFYFFLKFKDFSAKTSLTLDSYRVEVSEVKRMSTFKFSELPEPRELPDDSLDKALAELVERSRLSSGKLHIHDVEEVLYRRLGK